MPGPSSFVPSGLRPGRHRQPPRAPSGPRPSSSSTMPPSSTAGSRSGSGHRRHRRRWRRRRRPGRRRRWAARAASRRRMRSGSDRQRPSGWDLALVEPEDLLPAEGIAEVSLGDVPQRVAALHLVGRRPRASPRRPAAPATSAPGHRAARRPAESHQRRGRGRRPVPADQTRPETGRQPLGGEERSHESDRGDQPGCAPLQAAHERHCTGLAASHIGDGLDEQRRHELDPDQPADDGPGPSPGTRRGCRCSRASPICDSVGTSVGSGQPTPEVRAAGTPTTRIATPASAASPRPASDHRCGLSSCKWALTLPASPSPSNRSRSGVDALR